MSNPTHDHGWTAVPRSMEKLLASRKDPKPSSPVTVDEISLPGGPLVEQVWEYTKENLPAETFNHSMRVYYLGPYDLN